MSQTWLDLISEILSMLPYGWAFHEIVYKRRKGKVDPISGALSSLIDSLGDSGIPETQEDTAWTEASSEFDDGKIGWRKIPIRAQETLQRWLFDGYSGIAGMEQIDYHGGRHLIPLQKALLFRTKTTRNNPEGRSILRNAWTSFYRMTNIQQIEAIGIERDLAGIPVVKPPPGIDLNQPQHKKLLAVVEELVRTIRRDEDEGVVFPSSEWELELLTTGGTRQIDTNEIIRRYEQRIASSCLADFVLLGQDALGSFAMVDIKSELFGIAIDTVLDIICETFNKHGIPRLLALNGMKRDDPPKITHSDAGRLDLEKVGRFLQSIALAGGQIPWSRELMEEMFKEAGLPAKFDGPLETAGHPTGDVHREGAGDGSEEQEGRAPAREGANGQRAQGEQNDPRERTLPVAKLSKSEQQSGAMVCLYPSPMVASQLAQQGGLPADELHLTLAFLGEAAGLTDPERLRQIVQGFAASCAPMTGKLSGIGHFTEPEDVTYGSADVPFLAKHREKLASSLRHGGYSPSAVHGFDPHITLAYANIEPKLPAVPLIFDSISLVIGSKREDFPLTGIAHVQKAEDGAISGIMAERAGLLSAQLEAELRGALGVLGEEAASAYLHEAQKSDGKVKVASTTHRVMSKLNVKGWTETRLMPILHNAHARVALDTQRVLQRELKLPLSLDQHLNKAEVGSQLRAEDIDPQVRASILEAITAGLQNGESPIATARRIRESVPAGRFTKAGPSYRAELIARNETANQQRDSQLGLYESNDRVQGVNIRDGIYGPPRSDQACMDRNGEYVPIAEARKVLTYHPLCTLGFDPVIE